MTSMLSPELTQYAAALREWGRDVTWGHARQTDTDHALPPDVDTILATSPVPLGRPELAHDRLPEFPDGTSVATAVWYESLAYGDLWLNEAINRGIGHFVVQAIGTPRQEERWWTPIVEQGGKTGFGLSEAGAGSDTRALTTSAIRDGDNWVINGTKMFCSLGAVAEYVVVFARVAVGDGGSDIKAFVVERGHPGLSVVRANEDKLGLRCWLTSQLAFDDVVVPLDHLLGWHSSDTPLDAVRGLNAGLAGLNDNRPNVSQQAVGVASAALDVAGGLLRERRFGFTTQRWSMIDEELGNMAAVVRRCRGLNLRAQWLVGRGIDNRAEASIAKAFGPGNAERVIRRCMQLLGPEGLSTDLLLEKWYRDIKILDIFEGTGQIMRMLVSRSLMGRTAAQA